VFTAGLLVAAGISVTAGAVFGSSSVALAASARSVPAAMSRAGSRTTEPAVVDVVGLSIRLKVTPTRVARGAVVTFSVELAASHAVGALGLRLSFGDGTGRGNPIPQYCLVGVYHVTVTGFVNCSAASRVAKATVVVT
jgi:hypothetical protein